MSETVSFRPVKTKRAFEEVCDQIRAAILSGRLEAGDKLPSERELATTLDVSRATIREAFRTLEIAGVLSLRKGVNGGAVVMQGDARPITQTISDLLSLGGLSLADCVFSGRRAGAAVVCSDAISAGEKAARPQPLTTVQGAECDLPAGRPQPHAGQRPGGHRHPQDEQVVRHLPRAARHQPVCVPG